MFCSKNGPACGGGLCATRAELVRIESDVRGAESFSKFSPCQAGGEDKTNRDSVLFLLEVAVLSPCSAGRAQRDNFPMLGLNLNFAYITELQFSSRSVRYPLPPCEAASLRDLQHGQRSVVEGGTVTHKGEVLLGSIFIQNSKLVLNFIFRMVPGLERVEPDIGSK